MDNVERQLVETCNRMTTPQVGSSHTQQIILVSSTFYNTAVRTSEKCFKTSICICDRQHVQDSPNKLVSINNDYL